MKKLTILFIFVFACFGLHAQQKDTVYIEQVETLELQVKELQHNFEQSFHNIQKDLERFNKRYSTGTGMILTGIVISWLGVYISARHERIAEAGYFISLVGGGFMGVGWGFQVSAHKYLGGKESLTVGVKIDF